MLDTTAYILLALYIAIIVVSYFAVRRGWMRASLVLVIGGIANALVAFAFPLALGDMLLQAAIVGPITGFVFVALSVVLANHYRDVALARAAQQNLIVPADSEPYLEQVHRSAA